MEYGGYGKEQPRSSGLDYAQLGLGIVGTGLQGFGAYQAYLESERQRNEERQRFEEQKRIEAEERRKRDELNRQNQIMGFGQYAQGIDQNRRQAYGAYAARVGL